MLDFSDIFQAKFSDGGRGEVSREDGRPRLDCWGLVMAVFKRFGVAVPDFAVCAGDTAAKDRAYQNEKRAGRWERLERPDAPCLVAMRTNPRAPKCVNHFGVYVGHGRFLHIFDDRGVHQSRLDEPPWPRQACGFWRWRG